MLCISQQVGIRCSAEINCVLFRRLENEGKSNTFRAYIFIVPEVFPKVRSFAFCWSFALIFPHYLTGFSQQSNWVTDFSPPSARENEIRATSYYLFFHAGNCNLIDTIPVTAYLSKLISLSSFDNRKTFRINSLGKNQARFEISHLIWGSFAFPLRSWASFCKNTLWQSY